MQGATALFISLWPTKLLMIGEDMNLGRQVHVPAFLFQLLTSFPLSLFWFPWSFMMLSPKPTRPQQLRRRFD